MKLETKIKCLFKAESLGRNKQNKQTKKEIDISFNPIFWKIEMGANCFME